MNDATLQLATPAEGIRLARAGDTSALTAWLDAGADPNGYDDEGWTPLLGAAARGHADAVELLLSHTPAADPDLRCTMNGALPIHMAGHSGSVAVAEAILARRPTHLEEIWDINGHTLLLQAAFYGHVEQAAFAVARGANPAATTLRGLSAYDLAVQFQNVPLKQVLAPAAPSPEAKAAYFQELLARIAPITPPAEMPAQRLADRLVEVIQDGLDRVTRDASVATEVLAAIRDLVETQGADVNRLGGVLRQPPLVVTVTGNNGEPANPAKRQLRIEVAKLLLVYGADPTRKEVHPMGANAVIRASVFNHLEILKLIATRISTEVLAGALNEKPVVNALTALHDTVLRASTAGPDRLPGYLDQIRWAVSAGARYDIEDFSGRTQLSIAEHTANPDSRRRILAALGVMS